jgi:hypothetical protein
MKQSALILWQRRLKTLWPFLFVFTLTAPDEALRILIKWGLVGWAIILITLFIGDSLLTLWFSKVAFHKAFFNLNKKEK